MAKWTNDKQMSYVRNSFASLHFPLRYSQIQWAYLLYMCILSITGSFDATDG